MRSEEGASKTGEVREQIGRHESSRYVRAQRKSIRDIDPWFSIRMSEAVF